MRVDESVRTSQTASLLASISTVVSIVRLGTDVFCEEAGHDGSEFGGTLRVRVVLGAFEDPERPERSAAVDWRGRDERSSAVPASRTTLSAGNTSAGLAEPGVPRRGGRDEAQHSTRHPGSTNDDPQIRSRKGSRSGGLERGASDATHGPRLMRLFDG